MTRRPLRCARTGAAVAAMFALCASAQAAVVDVTVMAQNLAAADPSATRGTIGGLQQPGGASSRTFRVDTALNPFFTFGTMAAPGNDFFIGNNSLRSTDAR